MTARWSPWNALWVCAGLTVVGSFLHGTTRTWEKGVSGSETVWAEGAGRWAGWTFLLGILGIGLLLLARRLGQRGHARLALLVGSLTALPFGLALRLTVPRWESVLDERARERDYILEIAPGLAIVSTASAVGVIVVALLLIRPRSPGAVRS